MSPWMYLFFAAAIALVRERQRVNSFIERVSNMPPRFLVVVIVVAMLAVPQFRGLRHWLLLAGLLALWLGLSIRSRILQRPKRAHSTPTSRPACWWRR